jgi:hypothetical protein
LDENGRERCDDTDEVTCLAPRPRARAVTEIASFMH